MILPKFEYHAPKTLEEACRIMGELGEKAAILAGGTDLLVNMKKKLVTPANVVSLGRVEELRDIVWLDDRVEIGACCTIVQLQSEKFEREFAALKNAADCLGSPLVRNLATAGGNLASARPAADIPPPLMVYNARVVLKNSSGERMVPLSEFFLDVGKTAIKSDEILTRIVLPKAPPCSGSAYVKLGVRKSLEIALVNVAAFLSLNGETIAMARVVMGAVAPVPLRATAAENLLIDERPDDALLARAASLASEESRPIDNFRGSAEYRRAMVKVLTERMLHKALERARNNP